MQLIINLLIKNPYLEINNPQEKVFHAKHVLKRNSKRAHSVIRSLYNYVTLIIIIQA